MKTALQAGSILTALALSIVGCDPAEPLPEAPETHGEPDDSKQGPPSPPPPVDPSPIPALPSTVKAERDAATKQDEAKAAEKKDESKFKAPEK